MSSVVLQRYFNPTGIVCFPLLNYLKVLTTEEQTDKGRKRQKLSKTFQKADFWQGNLSGEKRENWWVFAIRKCRFRGKR